MVWVVAAWCAAVWALIWFIVGVAVCAKSSVDAERRAQRAERRLRELESEMIPFDEVTL